jgi:hypothetical protein
VHKVPFLEFSPRELIKLFCSKIADSRQVLVADRPKICVRHLVPLLEFDQFPISSESSLDAGGIRISLAGAGFRAYREPSNDKETQTL